MRTDPVPENPVAAAHVHAPFRVGNVDIGESLACLRKQSFSSPDLKIGEIVSHNQLSLLDL